jgi:hypothetical protein
MVLGAAAGQYGTREGQQRQFHSDVHYASSWLTCHFKANHTPFLPEGMRDT